MALSTIKARAGVFVPMECQESVVTEPIAAPKVRPDFWRAFIRFPVPGVKRYYQTAMDKVGESPDGIPLPDDGILIEPIARATQLTIRRRFLDSVGSADDVVQLQTALDSPKPFEEFSRVLPQLLRPRWNRFVSKHLTEVVAKWADRNGIGEETWKGATLDEQSRRQRLYRLLDSVPLERLLELKIPLKWLV